MGEKFKRFVEWSTDCRYVPLGTKCGMCERKFGFFASGFWSVNARQLADCPICKPCHDRILGLLDNKAQWMPEKMQNSARWKLYSRKNLHKMCLQDARKLIALKEKADQDLLSGYSGQALLRVQQAFRIEPTPLQVGVGRSKQMMNKMVVFGCVEQGSFQKGDIVRIDSTGEITETTIIEAYVQQEDFPFEKELSAHMGRQRIPEGKTGWLVLDTEQDIFDGDLVIG